MAKRQKKAPPNQPVTIGIIDYDGVQLSAVLGLIDLFKSANRFNGQPTLKWTRMRVEEGLPAQSGFAVIIVPPCLGNDVPECHLKLLTPWITKRHKQGTLVASVCAGAFVLGQAGLLDGMPATTHWGLEDDFRSRFPLVNLDTAKLIVDDGDIITAGGLMAWVDLGLLLIGRYIGPAIMLQTARFFLVDPSGREQRFYSEFSPNLSHGDPNVLKVQLWLQKKCGEKVTLSMMAAEAGLGERTFLRKFHKAVGLNPTEYLQQLRVGKSREMLELSNVSIDEIAWKLGYENSGMLRKLFRKAMGISPSEYRRRFNVQHRKTGV